MCSLQTLCKKKKFLLIMHMIRPWSSYYSNHDDKGSLIWGAIRDIIQNYHSAHIHIWNLKYSHTILNFTHTYNWNALTHALTHTTETLTHTTETLSHTLLKPSHRHYWHILTHYWNTLTHTTETLSHTLLKRSHTHYSHLLLWNLFICCGHSYYWKKYFVWEDFSRNGRHFS